MLSLMKKLTRLIVLLLLLSTSFAQESKQLRIAILDFTNTGGLSKQETITLGNRLRSMLVKSNAFIVLERGQMDDILGEQGFQQTGCTTTECAVEMGALLNVEKMISGSIGKLGKTYTIDLSLIDVQTARIEKSFFRDFKGEIDGLLDLMEVIANQIAAVAGGLTPVITEAEMARIEITSDPDEQGGVSAWVWIGGGALLVGGAAVLLMSGSDTGGEEPVLTGFPAPPDRP